MKVYELVPGMTFKPAVGDTAVFIQRAPHPLWPNLQLVIWRMYGSGPSGDADAPWWSHDALSAEQDVGDPDWSAPAPATALRTALLDGAP